MKGNRYKKEKKFLLRKIITTIIFLLLIFIMIYSGIRIFNWIKENKQNQRILNKISSYVNYDENKNNYDKYIIDFEDLKKNNSDTVSWIKVNGTDIEYPIVKTSDNDFYITHSFDRKYNSAGWVFMDYRNEFDGTDKNIIIYGHNRKDGSMFGTLKNILIQNWQTNNENLIIPLISENEKEEYEVFSVYKVEKEEYYLTTDFVTDIDYQKFIDTIKSRSLKNFGIEVTSNDRILTLSTCADDNRYRVVLHAKKK